VDDIFVMFKYVLSVGTIIGPALWLVYFWRRLTTKAVIVQMILTICTTVIIPNVAPNFDAVRKNPNLTTQTKERIVTIQTKALQEDVETGRANFIGQEIEKKKIHQPSAIFFDEVVRENPEDPTSRFVGKGAFRNQIYYFSLMGVQVRNLTKSQLASLSFVFDIIFPFIILFAVSLFTSRNSEKVLREFYGAIHTPAVADADEDARLVKEAVDNPEIVEKKKLFPGSNWEFWKPDRWDIWGFVLSWVMVGIIILLYIFIMRIGT